MWVFEGNRRDMPNKADAGEDNRSTFFHPGRKSCMVFWKNVSYSWAVILTVDTLLWRKSKLHDAWGVLEAIQ